ncbi:MAG TPA: sugar phosphate isomerase/epimerase [Terriglobales bacterium]|nr:sugar phosphate isomerase/epimerase [Terriglobales bacterium]
MRIGLFTALFNQLSLDDVIKRVRALGLTTVELGTGNYPGDPHCPLAMLGNAAQLKTFRAKLEDAGLTISALSCHGNPLHPDAALRKAFLETSRKTIRLAAKLGVKTVIDFSGCPGENDRSNRPNWVTCPWPPEYLDVLKWQWEKKVLPFWREHARFAADHGVRIAIEMHPGFVVYSPETLLRLRAEAGKAVGCNFDPSHLFWQNIDPVAAVRILGAEGAIFHVHAKDTQIFAANCNRTGVLDTKPYVHELQRGWIFRTVGYGHGAAWWAEFISELRLIGYDDVLSIEHEDSLMSVEEGLGKAVAFLQSLVIREPRPKVWWA